MFKRRVSVIIFYDEERRILLQERTGIKRCGEEWGFFGGGIEEGETPEQALVREIKEELDYELTAYSFLEKIHYLTNEFDITLHAFIAPLDDKLTKFNQREGRGMKLFSLDEAKDLKLMPTDYPVLEALDKTI